MKCVTIVSYSVVINGHIRKKFLPTRGLKQGNPLSSFLFLLCGEGLSSLLTLATNGGLFKDVKVNRNGHRYPTSYSLMIAFYLGRQQAGEQIYSITSYANTDLVWVNV